MLPNLDDPTMRKREEFETLPMLLISDLRQTQPPARRAQLQKDSEALLTRWLDLTGQSAERDDVEARIRDRNEARRWKADKWEPQPFVGI
jgi:hypothetical protein